MPLYGICPAAEQKTPLADPARRGSAGVTLSRKTPTSRAATGEKFEKKTNSCTFPNSIIPLYEVSLMALM